MTAEQSYRISRSGYTAWYRRNDLNFHLRRVQREGDMASLRGFKKDDRRGAMQAIMKARYSGY